VRNPKELQLSPGNSVYFSSPVVVRDHDQFTGSYFIPEPSMFCLRAVFTLLGAGVCAYIGGCAVQAPLADTSRGATPTAGESALVSSAPVRVISADMSNTPAVSVTAEDIISWSIRGVSDDLIIDRIEHSNATFHLSPSQQIHLHDAGVSDDVIRAMKASAS
jgi:hypothetical protein